MQSAWRVACVRIPRFPIGAVWGAREAERGTRGAEEQLDLLSGLAVPSSPSPRAPRTSAADASRDLPSSERQPASDIPHWDELAIALADQGRLRAVTATAGRARIRAGMTVAEARSRCAGLEVLPWSDVVVEGAVTKATAALLVASPQVTPVAGAPGMWWVGASGFETIGGERGLVRTLLRVARLWHPTARVAVASSCVAARAATWGDGAGRGEGSGREVDPHAMIVPPGGCAAYLAPAPLGFIPMEGELRAALQALGLRTVGAFAALESPEVERRWGAVGLAAWRLARGEDRRRPVLARPEAKRAVVAELAMAVATMEPVLFLVRAALDRLVRELVADGRAAAAVAITLTLDDGRGALPAGGVPHTITREVRLPRAVARVAPLFERCRALLERWTLVSPVSGVAVVIAATAPAAGEQGNLLDGAWRDPAAAAAALERLRAELGPNVVVRPMACDEHRLERSGAWVDLTGGEGEVGVVGAARASAPSPARGAPPDTTMAPGAAERGIVPPWRPSEARDAHAVERDAALRLLEAPEAVVVECDGDVPCVLWWRGRRIALARATGPERLSGDWWRDGYQRDYWRCDGDESELLLYRTRSDGGEGSGWYLQGWYD